MKGIVIYQGKYGATRQYALWLGQSLELPVIAAGTVKKESLLEYDFFLIGTSVYIGTLQIKKWLKANLDILQGKKIFFFQVAGSPPADTVRRESYNRNGIPQQLAANCTCFFLPGRTIISKLSWQDRFMLRMGARLTKDKVERQNMLTEHDDVKQEHLTEMIEAVQAYMWPVVSMEHS